MQRSFVAQSEIKAWWWYNDDNYDKNYDDYIDYDDDDVDNDVVMFPSLES